MSTAAMVLFLLFTGPGFLSLGIYSLWHSAWRESVPALELLIDHATGNEPPPRTTWDKRFAYFQCWFHIMIGAFFSFVLLAVLISTLF